MFTPGSTSPEDAYDAARGPAGGGDPPKTIAVKVPAGNFFRLKGYLAREGVTLTAFVNGVVREYLKTKRQEAQKEGK